LDFRIKGFFLTIRILKSSNPKNPNSDKKNHFMKKKSDKELIAEWKAFIDNIRNSTPVDLDESEAEKLKRIRKLESNPEEWFRYYFNKYYTAEPAEFHLKATKRVLSNPEYYEVRSWSRELAKSARTMMEVLYLAMTGKKKNVLMVSNSYDNAERLLKPYKGNLEANNRIINDYGVQKTLGAWESGEFTAMCGTSFRAIGAGQSPRGTRNNEARPDVILVDDIDTDEECRNAEIIDQRIAWIEQALIPTRSVDHPMLIIVCGNIIAEYCCVTEMGKRADYWDVINIRDKEGESSWAKNSNEDIARIEGMISYDSFQKEYMNTPMSKGKVFKEITRAECPPLSKCDSVIVYADPSTSNKEKSKASNKCVAIVAKKGLKYYVYNIWVDTMTNASFVDYLFEADRILREAKIDPRYIYIENNSLQDPFYDQVLKPKILEKSQALGISLPIREDTRKKPDKYTRIEGTLEPLNRLGNLIFNIKEKENPHFQRAEKQLLNVSQTAKLMDAPDTIEGAIHLLENKHRKLKTTHWILPRNDMRY
jgi:hypothetical protein